MPSALTQISPADMGQSPAEPEFRGSVAFYFHQLAVGGTDFVILRLADYFARRGCKVWIVVRSRTGKLFDAVPPYVEVVDFNVTSTYRAIPRLRRFMIEHRPDILFTAYPLNNFAAVMARFLTGVPTRIVGTQHEEINRKFVGHSFLHKLVMPFMLPFLYGRADAIVAVSEIVRGHLEKLNVPARVLRVLPNPALDPDFDNARRQPVDHPWFRDPSRPIVISVGRLHFAKDFPTLIRAFARLRESLPARLVIVGEGEEEPVIRTLVAELGVEEDVWLTGLRRDPLALVSKSSVLVLSSIREGSPLVIVEALACDCPVVATSTAGATELLEGGRLGRLVPIGDHEALAAAMHATLTEPYDPVPGRKRAAAFTVEESGANYLALFRELCAKKPR